MVIATMGNLKLIQPLRKFVTALTITATDSLTKVLPMEVPLQIISGIWMVMHSEATGQEP